MTENPTDESSGLRRNIGSRAEQLDEERSAFERVRLSRATLKRLALVGALYVGILVAIYVTVAQTAGRAELQIIPTVIVIAFVFEGLDSSAGMGFGTALAPLLFILGYEPLQVVPILLLSEMLTGLVAGFVHHEFDNVHFELDPSNDATKLVALFATISSVAVFASIVLVYAAVELDTGLIKTYVGSVVVLMGASGLIRAKIGTSFTYRPKLLVGFAVLAGVNKGIGGGGYGPVITLGQLFSGVYEKSATAITTLSEGIVSLVGVITFFLITIHGVSIDPLLLPSIFIGGFFAAVLAPFLVRVVPNVVWKYVIPGYAFLIGISAIALGLDV
ncbi:sulfite exporter TauE/SafE [Halalkalicoccus paucihalophilus]|uniref:Probable membrane transporter protein n=1 Tax=Halalkalicoccus paucihalophilus TaxID=1008153 RepID=A0A151A835_9EURY|nr:TSUP family transporter [Halalkalicoccus paucihalophilus]KYH23779.1 sulfite exporter TauE/SafE [Halalkalicoccus paucihalophilus]